MMSGDQVYADDVAGPMLRAIHAGLRLGLFDEYLEGAVADDSASSRRHRADITTGGPCPAWTATRPCANAFLAA